MGTKTALASTVRQTLRRFNDDPQRSKQTIKVHFDSKEAGTQHVKSIRAINADKYGYYEEKLVTGRDERLPAIGSGY